MISRLQAPMILFLIIQLSKRQADIAIGGLVDIVEYRQKLSVSFPYINEDLRFTVPVGIPFTPLQKLLMPFDGWIWLSLLITLLIIAITSQFILRQPILDVLRILLEGSLVHMPRNIKDKMLMVIWIFAALIIRNVYQGALFDIMQTPIRHKSIETIADVIQFNYSVQCAISVCSLIEKATPNMQLQLSAIFLVVMLLICHLQLPSKYCRVSPLTDLVSGYGSLRDESFRSVFPSTAYHMQIFNRQHIREEPLRLSRDVILHVNLIMYLEKNSPLVESIDTNIHNLYSSGLLSHWANFRREVTAQKYHRHKDPKILTMDEMMGIFYICATLYSIAFIVCIWEIIIWNIKTY